MSVSKIPFATGLIVAVMLAVSVESALALFPNERKRWMLGISLGVGQTQSTLQGSPQDPGGGSTLKTEWEPGTIPQFRLGWVFLPNRLMVSFENKQWVYEQGFPEGSVLPPEDKLRVNIQQFSFALTWFPGRVEGPTGGLFVKAGAGWANGRFAALRPSTPEEMEATGGNEFTNLDGSPVDDAGIAYFGEMGYELRIFNHVGAGLTVTYSYLDLDGAFYKDATTVGSAVSVNWYW